jgi:hypothetical protein
VCYWRWSETTCLSASFLSSFFLINVCVRRMCLGPSSDEYGSIDFSQNLLATSAPPKHVDFWGWGCHLGSSRPEALSGGRGQTNIKQITLRPNK